MAVEILTRLPLLLWPGLSSPLGPRELSPALPPERSADLLDRTIPVRR